MTTYYRDGDVLVTSERIRTDGGDYRLSELDQVWHARGRRSWRRVAGRGALGMIILVPVLVGGVGIAIALSLHASAAVTVALIVGGVLAGLAAMPLADVILELVDRSYDRGSRTLEIWGRRRGRDVLLVRTRDRRRFGQIYRAVQRATEREAHRDARARR
ncbi:DUF6232 family protein [Mangrovihabitans endophyticus]|uniref:Uncharacterized protein n=1 Tax=Mangrovihabitans endophyticus TaxID=1751298 RepID=A0A8J3FP74_9ACTN|nr:DUF6232 family protein [Mangrovihabitans endophyticus]GGK98920.1 hypothetical protein GCM10012284_36560 [Mangrovihabitans endophyticus]